MKHKVRNIICRNLFTFTGAVARAKFSERLENFRPQWEHWSLRAFEVQNLLHDGPFTNH